MDFGRFLTLVTIPGTQRGHPSILKIRDAGLWKESRKTYRRAYHTDYYSYLKQMEIDIIGVLHCWPMSAHFGFVIDFVDVDRQKTRK